MLGQTMRYPLTLLALVRRAEAHFGAKELVSYEPNGQRFSYTYAQMFRRAKRLALALLELGVQAGDRVATLAWNHRRHLEALWAIPMSGGVLHALNARLHPSDLAYIVNHAGDRILLVDPELLPLWEQFRDRVNVERVIVLDDKESKDGYLHSESLLNCHDESRYVEPPIDEWQAATLCYTSGTTGRPKGVLHSHRGIVLQSWGWTMVDTFGITTTDVMMPVVPMFHVNSWGMPFTACLVGAKLVVGRPQLDFPTLARRLQDEKVTVTAGITTIWVGLLDYLDRHPGVCDLSRLRAILIGGSAVPQSMLEGFAERYGVKVMQSWGMTEMAPTGTIPTLTSDLVDAPRAEQYAYLGRPGYAVPFIELRARGEGEIVPWDGRTRGELETRGAWVVSGYYNSPEEDRGTPDGWFKTGDIATIDEKGCIDLQDRSKDLVKSGGEWISSLALETALMDHPAVLEAAVIAVPHPKWLERPLAVVVLRQRMTASKEELIAWLAPRFAKWWLPDAIEFVPELPHTPTGKCLKRALREQFRDYKVDRHSATG